MNQYIKIEYKPKWDSNSNYWDIWFVSNGKLHREKSPSLVYSDGYWNWAIHNRLQKRGKSFDWNKK